MNKVAEKQYSIELRNDGNYYFFENQMPVGFWTPSQFHAVQKAIGELFIGSMVLSYRSPILILPELSVRNSDD